MKFPCPTLFLVCGIALVAGPAFAGIRAPLDASGDLPFIADMPVFPVRDDLGRIDLAVRVDHPNITFQGVPGRRRASLSVQFKLAREGVVAVDTTQVFHVFDVAEPGGVASSRLRRFELLEISAFAGVGKWAATVRVRDLLASNTVSTASTTLEVLRFGSQEKRLSDAEFRLRSAEASLPNPERLFGVVQDTLEAYLELRGGSDAERVLLEVEVLDPVYGGMDQQILTLRPAGDASGALVRFPLGSFPEGNYILRLLPAWLEDVVLEYDFTVSWRVDRAIEGQTDVELEAELLLSSEELAVFDRLSRAARSQYMQDFWDTRDPTPGTARNEAHDRFLARVGHARRQYGEFGTPGPLTDRGRIYVQFGAPSEVSVEVMPTNGADLEDAIEAVHDTHAPDLSGVLAREQVNTTEILGLQRAGRSGGDSVLQDRLRNQNRIGQEGSFELWSYDMQGDPLFEGTAQWSESIDLRFLFVDRLGTGVYRLDFTNLATHY